MTETTEPTTQQPQTQGGWRRVHPVSPLLRSGVLILVVCYFVISNVQDFMIDLYTGAARNNSTLTVWITIAVIVGILIVIGVFTYLSWRFYQYRITDDAIEMKSGWIMRQHRRMRLDRMQAVDIDQPFLARFIGLAKLRLEAADGGQDSAMALQYLKLADAEALQAELLHAASGAKDPAGTTSSQTTAGTGGTAAAAAAEEELVPLLTIPTKRLIQATALSSLGSLGWLIGFLILLAIGIAVTWYFAGGAIAGILTGVGVGVAISIAGLTVFIFIIGTISFVTDNYGFTVNYSPNGLKNVYGLTSKHTQTIPPGRVQAIQVHQPFLWRKAGWMSIKVTTAGYGVGNSDKSTVLPVGTIDEVYRILSIIAPDPKDPNAAQVISAGLAEHRGSRVGYINAPRRAGILMWLQVRRHGFYVTPSLLIMRRGRLSRSVEILPHDRIQSIDVSQGPLQRRLKVASIAFHTSPGPVPTNLRNQDVVVAAELFKYESYIAAFARRISRRDAWMEPEELARFNEATAEARQVLGDQEISRARQ